MDKTKENVMKFLSLFRGADGDFALEGMDELCGYGEFAFDPDSAHNSAYLAGRRSVCVDIHRMLKQTNTGERK